LRSIPIPEETKEEVAEMDMELYLEKCHQLLYDFNAPDEKEG
jgi:hypothetical protein